MTFPFYPKLDLQCPNVSHCPHLGGASIGAVVMVANHSEQNHEHLVRQIGLLEKENAQLLSRVVQLQEQLAQAKLELKLERQNKFATNQQKQASTDTPAETATPTQGKKRGAPVGHPGWFRARPTHYDCDVEVPAPGVCPHCNGPVQAMAKLDPTEHLQEDIIDGVYRVVLYRHPACHCPTCDCLVQQAGKGEILNSRIGPGLRAKAIYLRNVIGISYRKVPRAIEELFGITFTPAALIGFETVLAERAQPLVEDIIKKIASSDGAIHADETYWTVNGQRTFFWVHGDDKFIHFQFDTSRKGEVSRNILGADFTGTLVTDCYAGYFAQVAGAKQKCLVHIARTARDWQKLVEKDMLDYQFFADVREFTSRGCQFYRQRRQGLLSEAELEAEKLWLEERLKYLSTCDVKHEKAFALQGRLLRHYSEWLVFVYDQRVPPTNNLAERALRPLVVMRKITFGNRSEAGAKRLAVLMTVAETSRRHGSKASDIYFGLFTRPPSQVMQDIYAGR
jgi:transposase